MISTRELGFVLVVDDYEAAARLYRDVLGLEMAMDLQGDGGSAVILRVPAATLEFAGAEPMADPVDTPWEIATSASGRSMVSRSRCSSRRSDRGGPRRVRLTAGRLATKVAR